MLNYVKNNHARFHLNHDTAFRELRTRENVCHFHNLPDLSVAYV